MNERLKKDIINYFKHQSIYGDRIYFDEDFDFNISRQEAPVNKKAVNEFKKRQESIMSKKQEEQQPKKAATGVVEDSVDKNWKNAESLDQLNNMINSCLRCPLGQNRTKFVFGKGSDKAKVMVIGEAPGRNEDLKGEPFVGRAGGLLTKILESIDLSREDVFIANILKCRPPNNRRPSIEEVDKCEPYLHKQIELINPEIILALGLTAADTLLKNKNVMRDIRGNILNYHDRKLMVTYHPAALLRNPKLKRLVWEDMKKLKGIIGG